MVCATCHAGVAALLGNVGQLSNRWYLKVRLLLSFTADHGAAQAVIDVLKYFDRGSPIALLPASTQPENTTLPNNRASALAHVESIHLRSTMQSRSQSVSG